MRFQLETIVTHQSNMDGIKERIAVVIEQIKDFGKEIELVQRGRNGNEGRDSHLKQGHNRFIEEPGIDCGGLVDDNKITTATLCGL